MNEPIMAIATGLGGPVAIIRISGSNLSNFYKTLFDTTPEHQKVQILDIPLDTNLKEKAVVLFFKGPHSFTGEDVIEIQTHGNHMLLEMIMKKCRELGIRNAEAGEFSKRAYLNEKISIAKAEAIADLITAQTTREMAASLRTVSGSFDEKIEKIKQQLLAIISTMQASLDFNDEDYDWDIAESVKQQIIQVEEQLRSLLANAVKGNLLTTGIKVLIAGDPNAGKSSLFNKLVEQDMSIVTEIAGTTRDLLHADVDIYGQKVRFIDSAGLRTTDDIVEQAGIDRVYKLADKVDIILYLLPADKFISRLERKVKTKNVANTIKTHANIIFVLSKIDLIGSTTDDFINISSKQDVGIEQLKRKIIEHNFSVSSSEFSIRARHIDSLENALNLLREYLQQVKLIDELAMEDIKQALQILESIIGKIENEDILTEIFSTFCIGK